MLSKLKYDIPASIAVFLVAIPLCLGIALASGAPLLSGVIAGIMGGVVVGSLSGSHTSVSGPAAGLTAIVISSLVTLGSFEVFLLAVVIAGLMQIVLGIAKAGVVANFIPSNVIKGLLAAIGIILILKQIPHAVGLDMDNEGDFAFFQPDGENTFSELIRIFDFFSLGAFIIAAISLIVLIVWDKTPLKNVNFLPSSLFVVVVGAILNEAYKIFAPSLVLESSHLVNIPKLNSISAIITTPTFESIGNYNVWVVALTIAVIASLETLLNLEATDNMDPLKRKSPANRELIAQGVGNTLSGLVGGLPLTSVIVRSSVNINSNAKTKMSAIFHGVFLFISVLTLSNLLNLIPLSSLAAILIITGYKLANLSLFQNMYKKGLNQFIPFITTILAIVFTDLLTGILIGSSISILFVLISNYSNPFTIKKEDFSSGETLLMQLPNQVSFLNKSRIKDTLWNLEKGSKLIIDASNCSYIDNDVYEILMDFKNTVSKEKEIQLNILGLKNKSKLEDQIQFVNIFDKETQQKLAPAKVLEILKRGNARFVDGTPVKKNLQAQARSTQNEQHPIAVILSCIDSRTSAELIFDLSIGDVFSVRIAGNVVNEDILGSMEFGCKIAGAKLIVVLGHTGCGAIKGACDHVEMENLSHLLRKIQPAVINEKTITLDRNSSNIEFVNKVTVNNIKHAMGEITQKSSIIKTMVDNNEIAIVGGLHDLATGKVEFYENN